jgi:hypothetical protein
MTWKRLRFCLYLVLLWPAAMFVNDRLYLIFGRVLFWLVHKTIGTDLPEPDFNVNALVPLSAALGVGFGLIPLEKLKTILLATFAPGRIRDEAAEPDELNRARPVLWAWVLPTVAFLFRLIPRLIPTGPSVLGFNEPSQHPISYFFGPLVTTDNYLPWFYDRLFFTSPMLLTAAYALAVLLRHRLPNLRHKLSAPIAPDPADTLGS